MATGCLRRRRFTGPQLANNANTVEVTNTIRSISHGKRNGTGNYFGQRVQEREREKYSE
jgi:hypothetical protein